MLEHEPLSNRDAFGELEVGVVVVQHSLDASSFHALPLHERPQLDQIVSPREDDDQQAGHREHARTFRRISASVNREDDIHAAILEGKATICIGHDPCQRGKATGSEPDRGHGQIEADGGNRLSCRQAAQQLARPRPKIDNYRVRWEIERQDSIDHGIDDSAADSGTFERRTRFDRCFRITSLR